MKPRLRFGFAFRMIAGLSALAAMTIAASSLSFLSFNRFRDGLGQIANDYVPALITASQLAQQSQSIVANAPALVVAESQITRRTVVFRINDQVAALDELINKLRKRGITADRLQLLLGLRDRLVENLRGLDQSVERRIENERLTQDLFQRIRRVGRRLHQLEGDYASDAAPAADAARSLAIRTWITRADETIELMLESFAINQLRVLETLRRELGERLERGQAVLAALPEPADPQVVGIQAELAAIALNPDGVVATRLARLDLNRSVEGMLSGNKIFADRFVSAVSRLVFEIETGVQETNQSFAQVVVDRSNLLLALSIICVLSTAAILVYIDRSAIRRLRGLQESMTAHVEGRDAEIDSGGTDEIADMAKALQFFVTTIHEREAALSASEQRLRSVTANLPGAVFRIMRSRDGRLSLGFISPGVRELTGLAPEELVGRPDAPLELVTEGERGRFLGALEKSALAGTQLYFEYSRGEGAEIRWARFLSFPRVESDGSVVWNGLMLDSTEWMMAEQAKRAFVSTVSHELRTPLTSIRGSLGLIAGGVTGELPERARRLVELATSNCERLTRLINDILDIEKVESGRMDFDIQPFALRTLLEQAIEANRDYGAGRQVRVALSSQLPDAELSVDGDRFIQIMSNLLSNAIKYSPDGGTVRVGATLLDVVRLRITVRDDGPGIPAAYRARVFDRFTQADSSDSRAKGGTGLGLSIARAIAERLGGNLGFDTTDAAGTTFFCDLPCRLRPHHQTAPLILICDDDPDISAWLKAMLERRGYGVIEARTARAAEELLAACQVDALLLDLHLPDGDGLALLRALRARPATAELPIIVISARAEAARRAVDGNALGVLDWLEKPIDEARLGRALGRVGDRGADRPRILHVEDDADLATIVATLVGERAEIINVKTRLEAVRRLEAERFDLVILDLGLPDGPVTDLLPRLAAAAGRPAIPVLVFTADEPGPELATQVAEVLTKSRTSNARLLEQIQALLPSGRPPEAASAEEAASAAGDVRVGA